MQPPAVEGELGDNVALEYTRDSPMFRQQLKLFEEAYVQVVPFAARCVQGQRSWCALATRAALAGLTERDAWLCSEWSRRFERTCKR